MKRIQKAIKTVNEAVEEYNHWAMLNSEHERLDLELSISVGGPLTFEDKTSETEGWPEPGLEDKPRLSNVGAKCIVHKDNQRYWGEVIREYLNGFEIALTIDGTNVVWSESNVEILK